MYCSKCGKEISEGLCPYCGSLTSGSDDLVSASSNHIYYDKSGDIVDLSVVYGVYVTPPKIKQFFASYTDYPPEEIEAIVNYIISSVSKKDYSFREKCYMRKQIESGFDVQPKRRRKLLVGIAAFTCLVLVGVSGYFAFIRDTTFDNLTLDSSQALNSATYSVDSSWKVSKTEDGFYYYPFEHETDGFMYVLFSGVDSKIDMTKLDAAQIEKLTKSMADGIGTDDSFHLSDTITIGKLNSLPTSKITGYTKQFGSDYQFSMNMIFAPNDIFSFVAIQKGNVSPQFDRALNSIIDTFKFDDTIVSKKLDALESQKLAQDLGYDSIFESETDGKIYRSGIKNLTLGELHDSIVSIDSNAKVSTSDSLDSGNEFIDQSLLITVQPDNATAFVSFAEQIVEVVPVKDFKSVTIVSQNVSCMGVMSISWDEEKSHYTSVCVDATDSKEIDAAYAKSEIFSKIDMMSQIEEEFDDIQKDYIVQ